MFVRPSLKRTFVAISAAVAMSTIAVGAAVGPAHAAGAPYRLAVHA